MTIVHHADYTLGEFVEKRRYPPAGDYTDFWIEVEITVTLNPAGVDGGSYTANVVLPTNKLHIPARDTSDSLGIIQSDIENAANLVVYQAIIDAYPTEFAQDWPGDGKTGHSHATNPLYGMSPTNSLTITVFSPPW